MTRRSPKGRGPGNIFARPVIFLGLILLATGFAAACANKNFSALRPGLETRGHYIEGVPFFRQSEAACGPAALAGILAFWGRPESLERITDAVYLPELRGTLPMDMEQFAREAGFKTTSSHGTLRELKTSVRQGTPVICLLDLGFSLYHRPHYVSVIGFDDVSAVFIAHDGRTPNSLIGYEKFDKAWSRAGRYMLAIGPGPGAARHGQ